MTVTVTAGAVVDGVNKGNLQASEAFSVDTRAPTVSTIAIASNPGTDRTYAADDEIRVRVTFSETVEVTGTPRLQAGAGRRGAVRRPTEAGREQRPWSLAYQVAGGESDTDGVGVEADSLSGGTIRDGSDNEAVLDHDGLAADAGHKVDAVRPELAASGGAVVNGTALTLTWDEPLDGSSTPAAGDFTVSGGDRTRMVTRVRVSGSTVLLTLDAGAEHLEAEIQVSYTPGTNPIRDAAGNQAEALSREPVTNETPDTTPPEVEQSGDHLEPGVGPDLCGGGRDRGEGDLQRDGGGGGDPAVEAESGEQDPDGRLPEKRHGDGGAGVRLRGGRWGRGLRRGEHPRPGRIGLNGGTIEG